MEDAGTSFNRFRDDSQFQRGFEAGGRLLVEGSLVLGRYGRSIPEASSFEESLADPENQETAIELWAKSHGYWFDAEFFAYILNQAQLRRGCAFFVLFQSNTYPVFRNGTPISAVC